MYASSIVAALCVAFWPLGALAAPTATTSQSVLDKYSVCDLTKASMPAAPTTLPPPSEGLTLGHVAIGQGTQNYTCKSSTANDQPAANGALATLFNVTCGSVNMAARLYNQMPVFALAAGMPNLGASPAQDMLSGHHYFTNLTTPFFNLHTDRHDFGSASCKKLNQSSAPDDADKGSNGLGSVAWLKLGCSAGEYKEVYRLSTAGGMAPATCEGMPAEFTVPYSALYWLWK